MTGSLNGAGMALEWKWSYGTADMSNDRSNDNGPEDQQDPDRTELWENRPSPGDKHRPESEQDTARTNLTDTDQHTAPIPSDHKPQDAGTSGQSLLGSRVGRYQVIDILGRGGMGTVYEAVQDNPRRRVALKVINPGLATDDVLKRFEHEAHVLGRLSHPGIADIYESGTFDLGAGAQPYFAMELVKGETLIDYARHHGLNTRQRLVLIARICRAVLHAHQKGIIHRDLKPANIIVIDDESSASEECPGQPKVLDFGVARATNADIQAATIQKEAGMLVGTFSYMSPEQATGDPDELDTRSDVYSLGVIAYELLGGRLPFNLNKTAILETLRVITQEAPPPLDSIDRQLKGDIAIIVDKALAKSKDERYQSALEFATDIERFLRNEPIVARPPSASYRLSKFVRRNKALVAGIAAVFLVLVGGVATATSLYLRAEAAREEAAAERDRAERHALELERVAQFQAEQLSGIDVSSMGIGLRTGLLEKARDIAERRGVDETAIRAQLDDLEEMLVGADFTGLALETLDEYIFRAALHAIDRQFDDQPLLRARLLQTLATTLRDLGRYELASDPQERALTIRRQLLDAEHPDTLESIHQFGNLMRAKGRYDEADEYLREALDTRQATLGEDHPDTLQSLNDIGRLLEVRDELDTAEAYYSRALDGQRRVLGSTHAQTLNTVTNLGLLLEKRGEHFDAETYLREALAGYRRTLGSDHRYTLNAVNNMGGLFWAKGDIDTAEQFWKDALEGRRRALGNNHSDTLASINNMGSLMRARGELEEAEVYFNEVVERSRRVLGEEHTTTLQAVNNMASLLAGQGRLEEAEPFFSEALTAQRRVMGDTHPTTLILMHNLAHVLRELGRHGEAATLGSELVANAEQALPQDHPHLGVFLRGYASALILTGAYAEAEDAVLESWRITTATHEPEDDTAVAVARTAVDLYQNWHESDPAADYMDKAAEWQARLPGEIAADGAK
jgi:eukaryotic-like serine/threonine-protein kinase